MKNCDGNCDGCECATSVNPIQLEFRQKLINLIDKTLHKLMVAKAEVSAANIADDLLYQSAALYTSADEPQSDALRILSEAFENIQIKEGESINSPSLSN